MIEFTPPDAHQASSQEDPEVDWWDVPEEEYLDLSDDGPTDPEVVEQILKSVESGTVTDVDTMADQLAYLERAHAEMEIINADLKAYASKTAKEQRERDLIARLTPVFRGLGVRSSKPEKISAMFVHLHPDFDANRKGAGVHLAHWVTSMDLKE
jgi:hypothetical protein